MSKVIKHVKTDKRAPVIRGLSKSEIKIWLAFCKSVNSNLNK